MYCDHFGGLKKKKKKVETVAVRRLSMYIYIHNELYFQIFFFFLTISPEGRKTKSFKNEITFLYRVVD